MAKNVQLNRVLWVYILFCWVGIAYASELSFADGIESIPLKAFGYVAVLSILGGMAATLPKIINPAIVITNLPGEIIKDVVLSFFAGLVVFLVAIWWEWAWSKTCLVILLAGAGNAKFIDMVLNKGFFPGVAKAIGKTSEPASPPPSAPPVNREESPQ